MTRRAAVVTALVIGVVALIVVVAVIVVRGRDDAQAPDVDAPSVMNVNTGPSGDTPRRSDSDPLVLGRPDAPVTMVIFSNFDCLPCVDFAFRIRPTLITDYVDTGVLRIEWRDVPNTGPAARTLARAGRAAAEQGRFWQFADAAMRAARDGGSSVAAPDVERLARAAGVTDIDRFHSDRDRADLDAQISSDLRLAQDLFIPPSPAYWVNGVALLGSQPLWAYRNVIEGAKALSR